MGGLKLNNMNGKDFEFFTRAIGRIGFVKSPNRSTANYLFMRTSRQKVDFELIVTPEHISLRSKGNYKRPVTYLSYFAHNGYISALYVLLGLKVVRDNCSNVKEIDNLLTFKFSTAPLGRKIAAEEVVNDKPKYKPRVPKVKEPTEVSSLKVDYQIVN